MNTRNTSHLLDSIARDFIPEDFNLLPQIEAGFEKERKQLRVGRKKWAAAAFLVLSVLFVGLLFLPQAAIAWQRLLGFIPGVGIVETNAPIRILAEPVSVTREGVTVSVTQAILTADRTLITYQVYGVPRSAYPAREDMIGCYTPEYLRLPDGSTLRVDQIGFMGRGLPPVPANVNEATFVLPCIENTLPGTVPENWELPLRFIPAPPDMTIMPVVEITASPESNTTGTPSQPQDVVVQRVIETADGYILMGVVNPHPPEGAWAQITSAPKITDAEGKDVFYITRNDVDLPDGGDLNSGGFPWAYEIQRNGVVFPVTISFSGEDIREADPQAKVEFEFNAGPDPQPGQEWTLNREFQIAGHTVKLVSIAAHHGGTSDNGYDFSFEADPDVTGLQVAITGYTPNGGGGGGGGGNNDRSQFDVGLSFATLPTGKMQIVLSDLTVITGHETWEGNWQPDNLPTQTSSLYGIALAVDKTIPLNGWVYLIGHTDWTDTRISDVRFIPDTVKVFDSAGREIPVEAADLTDAGIENPTPHQWAYRLRGDSLAGPLTLRATDIEVRFRNPVSFGLDLRPYGFDFSEEQQGSIWKTGLIPVDVPGFLVDVSTAKYIRENGMSGFEITLIADPALRCLAFDIDSGVTVGTGKQKAGCRRDEGTGYLVSYFLTDGKLAFPLNLSMSGASISDIWETTWNPQE